LNKTSIYRLFKEVYNNISGAVYFMSLEITYWLAKYPLFVPSLAKLGIFLPTKNTRLLKNFD